MEMSTVFILKLKALWFVLFASVWLIGGSIDSEAYLPALLSHSTRTVSIKFIGSC